MITIGVLGCGKIAEKHLLAYKKMPMVDVVISDIDPERTERTSRELKVQSVKSPEELFTLKDVHAVDICIPTQYHRDAIFKALAGGKDIFCEKPLCLNLKEALEIERKANEVKRIVMVGYLYRFHQAFQFTKDVLEEGIIGKPYFAIFRLGGRGSHTPWKHRKGEGGGAILEMLVHKLDLILWYFGDILEVELLARDTLLKQRDIGGKRYNVDAEDLVLLKLRADGVEIICESDLLTPSYMDYIEIHGDNGSIFTSILHFLPTIVFCKTARGVFNQGNSLYSFSMENLFEKELRHFVDAIRNGRNNVNSIEDSIKIFRIIEEMQTVFKENAIGDRR